MTKAVDARIRKSQTAIIEAGMNLLRRNSEVSLSDIALQAGVGRTTLYRLYKTKEELIKAIAIHCLETFDTATAHLESEATSAMHAFRLMFAAILPLSSELEFLMRLGELAEDDPELIAINQKQGAEIAELAELAKQEGSIAQKIPTSWIVNHIEGLLYSAWLTMSEEQIEQEALVDLCFDTFCHGVKR